MTAKSFLTYVCLVYKYLLSLLRLIKMVVLLKLKNMNFLKNAKYYFCALLISSMVACSSDKDDNENNGGGNGDGDNNYTESPLSPDENKTKLENIGKDFVAKINANDHKAVTESLYCLSNLMDDDSFDNCLPDYMQWDDEDFSGDVEYPINPVALANVIRNNDINALMKIATKSFDDEYKISDFQGTYSCVNGIWTAGSGTKNKWELQYTDAEHNNTKSVLTLTYSDLKEYSKVNNTLVEVPGQMTLTLTVDGKEVLKLTNEISLTLSKDNNDKATVKCNLAINGNYNWEINASADPDKVSSTFKMSVNNEELINGSAEMTGTKLTDPDNIEANEENILNQGNFNLTLMNVRLTGKADIKAIIKGEEYLDDQNYWESDFNEDKDKLNAIAAMELYNKNMNIEGIYVKEKQKFANIKVGTYYSEEEKYEYNGGNPTYKTVKDWDIEPVLIFTDNSELSFDTFFTKTGFSGLIASVETLVNKYMDIVGEDHVNL